MYESKKENALKTLEKKQTKVDEINKVRVSAALLLPRVRVPASLARMLKHNPRCLLETGRRVRLAARLVCSPPAVCCV